MTTAGIAAKRLGGLLTVVICLALCVFLEPVNAADSLAPALSGTSDFVITVETDNPGDSSANEFEIPTYAGETYNYNVDCDNDGVDEAIGQTGNYTCSYWTPGKYTIRIKDNVGDGTGFPRIYFYGEGDRWKLEEINQWGTGKWTSMENAFREAQFLIVTALDAPDLSNVTSLRSMFEDAWDFTGDFSNWDTSNIEDMSRMFLAAINFDSDISAWDTSNVTDMSLMFGNSWAFNQDISGWNTYNVQSMRAMFYDAESFNQDIGNWVTDNVTNLDYMFASALAFNRDLSSWNTSNVVSMVGMFQEATAFDQNIGSWDVSSLTDATGMFENNWLSTENYDALLNGWAVQPVHHEVPFDGGNSLYLAGEAARDTLINTFGWTIIDGGKVPAPPSVTFLKPLTDSEWKLPKTTIKVKVTEGDGEIVEVRFYGREVGGTYQLLGIDTSPVGGWSYLWETGLDTGTVVDVMSVVEDSVGSEVSVEQTSITLVSSNKKIK